MWIIINVYIYYFEWLKFAKKCVWFAMKNKKYELLK